MGTTSEIFPPVVGQSLPGVWRVVERLEEIVDTVSITITPADQSEFEFKPGQFCMVYIPGSGDIPISISGKALGGDGIVLTVRSVGLVSDSICNLQPGDSIGIRGPFGTGWPVDLVSGHDFLAIGGGLGGAPLRPAIGAVISDPTRTHSNAYLYGSRTPDTVLFDAQLSDWSNAPNTEVMLTVDQGDTEWHGNVGLVTALLPRVEIEPTNTIVFICGPDLMMRFTALELLDLGVPAENVYLSLERNMQCGVGLCGHCQLGGKFICTDGPVFKYSEITELLAVSDR